MIMGIVSVAFVAFYFRPLKKMTPFLDKKKNEVVLLSEENPAQHWEKKGCLCLFFNSEPFTFWLRVTPILTPACCFK